MKAAAPPPHRSLSARLLALTVLFVMVAEVLIFAPSIGRFRKVWLEERLDDAHLAILALEATPDGMVDAVLQGRLLALAGTEGITLHRPDGGALMLGPGMPMPADAVFDLRQGSFLGFIADAAQTMAGDGRRRLKVVGRSHADGGPLIEAIVPEAPLRRAMIDYAQRILALSLFISGLTAILVYIALHRLLVRPLRRLSESMLAFREAPEDARRLIRPSGRRDEVGTAESALAEMQRDLRAALTQKTRLAALGAVVTRIHHDLRGILATGLVVSERLEHSDDPEVRRLTPTLVKAIDRAVGLCSQTLSYAREGPPAVTPAPLGLRAAALEVIEAMAVEHPDCRWLAEVPAGLAALADRELVFRILANLGRNAAEAGARTILFDGAAAAGGRVELIVADDGPGLSQRAQQTLFQPFAGTARPGGFGLGLAIARELAAAQGGGLRLADTGATGSRFVLSLPAAPAVRG